MLQTLTEITNLTQHQLLVCIAVVSVAGLVRGFAGFALSAVVMASLAVLLPPIELIPICYILEATASLLMFRGGMRDANMKVVWGLVIGSAIGVPIGLALTTSIPIEVSKLIALAVILSLTVAQFFKASPKFLATKPGLYLSGIVAGIVTGLASVGGMVVALYVLASKTEAKVMRASLVMFLMLGIITSTIYAVLYGIMNHQAIMRALVFAPFIVVGVLLGGMMFRPSLAPYYKRFCLILLIVLSSIGLFRLM